MRQLRGKRALVTGAASGIGRAIALRLAAEGTHLALLDIQDERLWEVAEEVERLGCEVLRLPCDLSRSMSIDAAVDRLLAAWPALDLLVNNAGVVYHGPTRTMPAEDWEWLLAINLLAPIHLTRRLLPTLLGRPEAHIVNMASIFGLFPLRKIAAYNVAKYGLVGLSESLRAELGVDGLGVTVVCPGFVDTQLFQSGRNARPNTPMRVPPRWLLCTPQRVAEKTVQAIRRNRRLVLVSPLAYLFHHAKRFAPGLVDILHHLGRGRAMAKRAMARASSVTGQGSG
jgi:3-oxoacyl-[acyl-carrier protein] reductase